MVNKAAAFLIGVALAMSASANDLKLHFVGSFESGQIAPKNTDRDGFYIATLPITQRTDETMHTPDSRFGPDSGADTRVVQSDVVGGEKILPRKGNYFLRSEVSYEKNYLELNENVKNRPRAKIYMSDPVHRIDFDTEGYAGFSIFTPNNFENELGVRDSRGAAVLFAMSSDSSRTLMNLGVWVEAPANEAHWFVRTWNSDTSTDEKNSKMNLVDLGPVSADKGKWTDFVVHYRYNPFSTSTNPAAKGIPNSMNRMYDGNKGILQVWKGTGDTDADGNRKMQLMIDKVNTPVGLVPHATTKIIHHWRIYKFGWHSSPTTLTHPVWFGFDEIRQGLVSRDGTTFADVAPGDGSCGTDCGPLVADKPKPPTNLTVSP